MTQDFQGAKALVFIGAPVLVYQRDNDARWPAHWDFPGGGREGDETPIDCLAREVDEELGLSLSDGAIIWARMFPSMIYPTETAWFFVVQFPDAVRTKIAFGSEGQRWALRPLADVANMPNLVPALRERLSVWLRETGQDPI